MNLLLEFLSGAQILKRPNMREANVFRSWLHTININSTLEYIFSVI